MSDSRRIQEFNRHVASGGKVEATDWMPDDYRRAVCRFVEMHANSELMGVLPEREWILRAPTLKRKLALSAKVQDEVGHAQLLYRVAEDLGKPREAMLADLLAGKTKFHNVFHYPTESWADVGIIAWLVDAAAIVAQQALRESSYAPYGRTMKKICWEESVHILHGRDVVLTMVNGTARQRALVQDALERWWGPLMQMHGPRTDPAKDRDLAWRIKNKDNETLRQEFLTVYVPRIREIGLEIPDPALRQDPDTGRWTYTEPDWKELYAVGTRHRAGRAGGRLTMAGQPLQVYEVFRREREGGPMQHAGNLLAPDAELASHYAREFYGRRQESVRLWIVPRAAIRDLDDPDLLQPPFDRSFKKPAGYSTEIKAKLATARERAGSGEAGE
jgi:ring-1,2-phenylacetyl-CoA epoxidase subunit PaaA